MKDPVSESFPTRIEPYEGHEPYIFISYSHQDKALVFPILDCMRRSGYRFWYDEGIDPGSEWPEAIAAHLENSRVFIAFVSPRSLDSRNCRREINFALSREKEFLSVILEPVQMSPGMEMQISTYQSLLYYKYQNPQEVIRRFNRLAALQPCRQTAESEAASTAGTPVPDADNTAAGTGTPVPDANSTASGTGTPAPDADSTASGTGTPVPGTGTPAPGTGNIASAVGTAVPGTSTAVSGTNITVSAPSTAIPATNADTGADIAVSGTDITVSDTDIAVSGTDITVSGAGMTKARRQIRPSRKKPGTKGKPAGAGRILRRVLAAAAGLIAVILVCLLFVIVKPFSPRLKIGEKTIRDTSSSVIIRNETMSEALLRRLSRFRKCTSLTLSGCTFEVEVGPYLGKMPQLHSLYLSDCTDIGSLADLSSLEDLSTLKITGCQLTDEELSGFSVPAKITTLDLSRNQLTKLPAMENAQRITLAAFRDNRLEDASPLYSRSSLTNVDLSGNSLTDLAGLEKLERLKALRLGRNQIADISPLTSLVYLEELDLGENRLSSTQALQSCTVLKKLDLSYVPESCDLSFLRKNVATLSVLNLSGLPVGQNASLQELFSSLSGLKVLGLDHCDIESLAFLGSCRELTWLSLAGNRLTDLTGLEGCPSLTYLNVCGNNLTSLEGLPKISDQEAASAKEATFLAMDNELTDCSGFGWPNVSLAALAHNPVTDFSALQDARIRYIIADIQEDTDLSGLPVADYFTRYFIGSVPTDMRVSLETQLKKAQTVLYVDPEETMEEFAADKMVFPFN